MAIWFLLSDVSEIYFPEKDFSLVRPTNQESSLIYWKSIYMPVLRTHSKIFRSQFVKVDLRFLRTVWALRWWLRSILIS